MSAAYSAQQRALGQFMTPRWAADELFTRYFGDHGSRDFVMEPSCGDGRFLFAIAPHVPAIGVEIDSALAVVARTTTGRRVIDGDFTTVELDVQPTAIVRNPPFASAVIEAFLTRALELLPPDGRVGFLLPVSFFQTSSTVARFAPHWSMSQDLVPRNLYPRLQLPLCFAQFRKGLPGVMVGFALYNEGDAVNRLAPTYRATLVEPPLGTWASTVRQALIARGGEATLDELYAEVESRRPSLNPWRREKVRQQVQRVARRVGPARTLAGLARRTPSGYRRSCTRASYERHRR